MEIMTLGQIARKLGVPDHRIKYVVDRHRIEPRRRVGILRVWDEDAVSRIEAALEQQRQKYINS